MGRESIQESHRVTLHIHIKPGEVNCVVGCLSLNILYALLLSCSGTKLSSLFKIEGKGFLLVRKT